MVTVDMSLEEKRGCVYSCGKYLKQLSIKSSIHGVRYVGQNRTAFERFLWGLFTLSTFLLCFSLIVKLYVSFRDAPVVITYATQPSSIQDIPFPAVTICPETKTRTNIFHYRETANKIRNGSNVTEFEKKAFYYLYLICTHDEKPVMHFDDKYYDNDFYKTLDELTPKFEDVMYRCIWMGTSVKCSDIFTTIFIDQGVCYSFNLVDKAHIFKDTAYIYGEFFKGKNKSNDWNMDSAGHMGYKDANQFETYPRRAFMSGNDYSLKVLLTLQVSDFDIECKNAFQGFRVVIDSPFVIPRGSKHYFRVSPQSYVTASVTPQVIQSSESVVKFSPSSRNCFLETERPLKYFKTYLRSSCILECLSNYTLRRCECTSYFMPREKVSPICGAYHYQCVRDAMDELQLLEIYHRLKNNESHEVDSFCSCLPSCENLKYDVEVYTNPWNFKLIAERRNRSPSFSEDVTLSGVNIYFSRDFFIKHERNEVVSPGDLLAKLGGLLNLFTGISIITVMEIIYLLSVRLVCNKYLYGLWTGPN